MSYIYQLSLQCFNCFLLESPAPHCVGQHVATICSCPWPSPSVFSPAGLWLRGPAPPQPSLGGLPTARGLAGRGTLTPARECRPQTRVRGTRPPRPQPPRPQSSWGRRRGTAEAPEVLQGALRGWDLTGRGASVGAEPEQGARSRGGVCGRS